MNEAGGRQLNYKANSIKNSSVLILEVGCLYILDLKTDIKRIKDYFLEGYAIYSIKMGLI